VTKRSNRRATSPDVNRGRVRVTEDSRTPDRGSSAKSPLIVIAQESQNGDVMPGDIHAEIADHAGTDTLAHIIPAETLKEVTQHLNASAANLSSLKCTEQDLLFKQLYIPTVNAVASVYAKREKAPQPTDVMMAVEVDGDGKPLHLSQWNKPVTQLKSNRDTVMNVMFYEAATVSEGARLKIQQLEALKKKVRAGTPKVTMVPFQAPVFKVMFQSEDSEIQFGHLWSNRLMSNKGSWEMHATAMLDHIVLDESTELNVMTPVLAALTHAVINATSWIHTAAADEVGTFKSKRKNKAPEGKTVFIGFNIAATNVCTFMCSSWSTTVRDIAV
jgi:hypothetical protein